MARRVDRLWTKSYRVDEGRGVEISLIEDPTTWESDEHCTHFCLWDAAKVLIEYCRGVEDDFWRERRVLEVGAGLGAVGMYAAHRGARVRLTDLPRAVELLRRNVRANGLQKRCEVAALAWGAEPAEKYDLLLGSDLTFDLSKPKSIDMLLDTMAHCRCDAWIAVEHRPGEVENWESMLSARHAAFQVVHQGAGASRRANPVSVYKVTWP
mmetsp:Transcript_5656/g.13462  ORF Transcript_5656/g.13462 Transcript_5656/m.13462 type:complete len:210 (-) Transcript_5656:38-667(-)